MNRARRRAVATKLPPAPQASAVVSPPPASAIVLPPPASAIVPVPPALPAPPAPTYGDALRHYRAGRLDEAEQLCRDLLAQAPTHGDALHLLGVIAHQRGRHDLAVVLIGRAIAGNAAIAAWHANLGSALAALGQPAAAAQSFGRSLALAPDANGFSNLGTALGALGRLGDAIACFGRALQLQPDHPDALSNLGHALREQGLLEPAAACCERALALVPGHAQALNNLGNIRRDQGRLDEAVDCLRRAVGLRPDYANAHTNLGMALLAQGDFAEGWEEFEWRWQTSEARDHRRHLGRPRWNGVPAPPGSGGAPARPGSDGASAHPRSDGAPAHPRSDGASAHPRSDGAPAPGRTLLIHAEQGFGDTLQFCRLATLAAARGLRVVMEVQRPLVRLLRGLAGVDQVLAQGDALPAFDVQCPMLSLPRALGITLASLPAPPAYLHAEAGQVAYWRQRLEAAAPGMRRVGLVWAGAGRDHNPAVAAVGRRRSLDPALLAPLFQLPGVRFVSLQKDGPAAPPGLPIIDAMAGMADFADTAALVAALDLVISVDTAVAHLAAALGRPVWLLDRHAPCWRWLLGRRDSPWYPGLRIYRQPQQGDWPAVVAEVGRDLGAADR